MEFRPVDHFISELLRAANEVDRLTVLERARLLRLAASTIKAYRDQIDHSGTPANDTGPGDVVFDLESVAGIVEIFPADKISAAILEAVECIKAGRALLEAKREVQAEAGQL